MNTKRKSKIYYYIILPSIIALAIGASILVWVNGIKNTIWVLSIFWASAVIISCVIFILHAKIVDTNKDNDSDLTKPDSAIDPKSKLEVEDPDQTLQI